MAGMFDEDLEAPTYAPPPPALPPMVAAPPGAPDPRRIIIATPPTPPPSGNIFDEDLSAPPPPIARDAVDWSKFNQPFGEIKKDDPNVTERVTRTGQDVLMSGGMDPYRARHLAEGGVGIANITPMGSLLSAGDLGYDASRGNWGHAALDAVGTLPIAMQARRGVQALRGELPSMRMADTPTRTVNPLTGAVDDELLGSARGHYNAVARSPVVFHPGTMPNFTDAARMALQQPQFGAFTPEAAQGVHALLTRWGADFAGPRIATPHDFDVLRHQLRQFTDGADSAAGPRAADFVDQFLSNPHPGSVLRGTPEDLGAIRRHLDDARGDYRAGKTAETVEYGIDRAGLMAGGVNSGLNAGDKTRQALNQLTNPPVGGFDKIFGATYPEKQSLRAVSQGDPLTNRMRYYGNRMGGGGGIGGAVTGGSAGYTLNALLGSWGIDPITAAATGALYGKVQPKIGEALRVASNERTVKAAEDAVDAIRRNSPLYRAREAASPDIADPRAMLRDAIAYAMMPQLKARAANTLDEAYVPYGNRGQ